jgi:hypothetical protein
MKEVLSVFTFASERCASWCSLTVLKPNAISAVPGPSKPEYCNTESFAYARLPPSSPQQRFGFPMERHSYISTPHTSTSLDPVHWKDPNAFDPSRYLGVPTSDY